MANVTAIQGQFKDALTSLGKAGLNALFPKDFEYYSIALELVDDLNNTVDYFSWPILPSELTESVTELTNIRKTMTGVNVLKNPTFTPTQITIQGNFGRTFKIVVNNNPIEFAGLSIQNGFYNTDPVNGVRTFPSFSSFAKTGYGCIKVLEAIKNKSKQLDQRNKKPYKLFLYNPILGNNYQVEFNTFRHMQNEKTSNMIPNYMIQLTSVASLDNLLSVGQNLKSTAKSLAFSNLQKSANSVARNLRSVIG